MVSTAWDVVAAVPDPEIPVLDIAEMGILRSVEVQDGGHVIVTITPTYSGCPAMHAIETTILDDLGRAGFTDAEVKTALSPAWTTDWMTEDALRKLEDHGIAPPVRTGSAEETRCPQCGSANTDVISPFGSTACKALMVCAECGEPFHHFKTL
ncbi:MAG: phenylacetate-CoA oxygenase subunit PaaJ [Acidimicrobiia bacterium]|jgi:ring-1,2-phenylacetyl-CoA epoxidase subunit PaaD